VGGVQPHRSCLALELVLQAPDLDSNTQRHDYSQSAAITRD
jgi:hypothetical protein